MGSVSQLTALLLLGVGVTAGESQRTQEERNTIAVFSKARLGVVHIKASQQESTDFGTERSFEGTGSGFLVDEDGHVLTNYHVVGSANRIEVYLPGGRMAVARVVGTAPHWIWHSCEST